MWWFDRRGRGEGGACCEDAPRRGEAPPTHHTAHDHSNNNKSTSDSSSSSSKHIRDKSGQKTTTGHGERHGHGSGHGRTEGYPEDCLTVRHDDVNHYYNLQYVARLDHPPEAVYRLLTHPTDGYAFFRGIKPLYREVLEDDGHGRRVVAVGLRAAVRVLFLTFHAEVHSHVEEDDEALTIRSHLVRSGTMKRFSTAWSIRPIYPPPDGPTVPSAATAPSAPSPQPPHSAPSPSAVSGSPPTPTPALLPAPPLEALAARMAGAWGGLAALLQPGSGPLAAFSSAPPASASAASPSAASLFSLPFSLPFVSAPSAPSSAPAAPSAPACMATYEEAVLPRGHVPRVARGAVRNMCSSQARRVMEDVRRELDRRAAAAARGEPEELAAAGGQQQQQGRRGQQGKGRRQGGAEGDGEGAKGRGRCRRGGEEEPLEGVAERIVASALLPAPTPALAPAPTPPPRMALACISSSASSASSSSSIRAPAASSFSSASTASSLPCTSSHPTWLPRPLGRAGPRAGVAQGWALPWGACGGGWAQQGEARCRGGVWAAGAGASARAGADAAECA
ncbi:hypothetical protein HYH03_011462 [Edaphochlamys debaryana]|uniref:Uncharacterized protein n=1 Tax=Edaphochlamys debaryana TaxID=47281 RepID=A0A835Y311_9CHLO|nr:hypothetical protein HYH03_011462 [Edaphochlamys debaryana]|eukprot:KAG2490159.1 hypothetical protein HYH03_011462 [Edaphochlamys debaryana]